MQVKQHSAPGLHPSLSWGLSYSVTLRFIARSCTLEFILMSDFVTSYIGHLENIGSLSYAGLQNIVTGLRI